MTSRDFYRIRDFVPDFDAIAEEIAARSRSLSARARMRADISYGERPRETLDIIYPENPAGGAPLHIFIHGGYWRSGEKADYRCVAEPALAIGAVTALIEYDLMPDQRLDVLVGQVRRAVRWLQDHAREFGADPGRITTSGHSAGAHLASYLAAIGPTEVSPPVLPDIKGLFLLSGIYDLSEIPDSFLRNEAAMTHLEAASWSPLTSVQQPGPLRVIAYGGEETAPFHQQAMELHDKLRSNEQNSDLFEAQGLNHMNVVLDLADLDGALARRLQDLLADAR